MKSIKQYSLVVLATIVVGFNQSSLANDWESQLEAAVLELKQSPPPHEMLKCYGVNQEQFIQAYKKAFMKCYPKYVPLIANDMSKEKDLALCFESDLLSETGATKEELSECND
ncbi:hypothetical protein ACUR5C_05470 [Aliikangiella sp. IMCC44653]